MSLEITTGIDLSLVACSSIKVVCVYWSGRVASYHLLAEWLERSKSKSQLLRSHLCDIETEGWPVEVQWDPEPSQRGSMVTTPKRKRDRKKSFCFTNTMS